MQSKVMQVTPKQAADWLEVNHCNRPLSRAVVEKYRHAIYSKRFYLTHQGIALDEQGRLRDGQHRLQAIVDSGKTVKLVVTTDLPEEAVQAIDDGRKRTDQQVLSMAQGEYVSPLVTAVAKEMYGGGLHLGTGIRRPQPSRLDLIAFYETHRDAIQHVVNFFRDTSHGTAVSYVIVALVRAWINGSRKKLDRFAEVLAHGYSKEGEEVIIRLRNYILRRRREQRQTQALRDDLYARTERAIEMFLANEDGQLTAAKDERFALPEDEDLRALVGDATAE